MLTQTLEPPRRKRIFCNRCKVDTNHDHEAHRTVWSTESDDYWEQTDFILWICAGCEGGTLEERWTMTGMEDSHGKQVFDPIIYYPKRIKGDVGRKKFKKIPEKLDRFYGETIEAFNGGLNVLCAAGLRGLIEGICADKGVTGSSLEKKIDALVNHNLPQNIVEGLHGFRFMGNTAVHELIPPQRDDLRLAIEISEDLLNYFYDLDYKAQRLVNSQRVKTSAQQVTAPLPVQE